jgi:hypothetical protein
MSYVLDPKQRVTAHWKKGYRKYDYILAGKVKGVITLAPKTTLRGETICTYAAVFYLNHIKYLSRPPFKSLRAAKKWLERKAHEALQ